MSTHEIIYTARNVPDAYQIKGLLDERGIDALVQNESLQGAIGELPPGMSTSPTVVVAVEQVKKAREVVVAYERQLAVGAPKIDDLVPELAGETVWEQWPQCPECERRRQAVCPVCQEAGNNFPLAEYNVVPEPVLDSRDPASSGVDSMLDEQSTLLMCHHCDEAFSPRFYRLCQWCGHDHGEGIKADRPPVEQISNRAMAVIMMLGGMVIALLGYLLFLYR